MILVKSSYNEIKCYLEYCPDLSVFQVNANCLTHIVDLVYRLYSWYV